MSSEISATKTLRTVLERYPTRYRSDTFKFFPTGRGFSGATICRVETEAGQFCLRGWPPKSYPVARILGLHSLLVNVFREGVTQVPVPVAANSGRTVVEIDTRLWQLEPWMPGIADFQDNPSESKLKSIMRCLASFHTVTRSFQPTEEQREWFFVKAAEKSAAVRERLDFLKSLGFYRDDHESFLSSRKIPDDLQELLSKVVNSFRSMYAEVETGLMLCANEQYPLQPCLKDIWHDHVLFTKDEVTGLIDASACRSDSIVTDLSRLLGSFCGNDRKMWEIALQEYETIHPLMNPRESILLEVLDRSGVLLSGMNWVEKFRHNECAADDLPGIAKRLNTIIKRLECLF